MKVAIVDYGMGNLHSLEGALNFLECNDICITNDINVLNNSDKIILPGVGNFNKAMIEINNLGLYKTLNDLIVLKKKPILGICLGMQLLGLSSTEGAFNRGLEIVSGKVEKFTSNKIRVPHVGFNQVNPNTSSRLYRNLYNRPDFYFTHSYRMTGSNVLGTSYTNYGDRFIASYEFENVAGVQFHPELSQKNGLLLLKNFIELF